MFLEWESNSGKLQIISGKFQNNAINDVKQISLSHVVIGKTIGAKPSSLGDSPDASLDQNTVEKIIEKIWQSSKC